MDPSACKALLDWVNSNTEKIHNLGELQDGRRIVRIIHHMQHDESEYSSPACTEFNSHWTFIKEFLYASNFHKAAETVNYDNAESGDEMEIAKVITLLLSLSITCRNHKKLITDMMNLSNETQWGIRQILSETLDEGKSPVIDVFSILLVKAPSIQEGECTLSPLKGAAAVSFMSPLAEIVESPIGLPSKSLQSSNISSSFQTPIKQIFKSTEDEVISSAPASCPPFRKSWNCRTLAQDSPSLPTSNECSPMQEFLASPVVNYRIKMRDLNQKHTVLRKNLDAERIAREECEKSLFEKESLITDLEQKLRDMLRSTVEKQQLFDEIDELHEVRQQRDVLERENSILKHRIEKFDTYASESKDLKKILDSEYEKNADLVKQVKSLQNTLSRINLTNQQTSEWEESLKTLQDRNSLLEQEISEQMRQLCSMKSQNVEQKEYYESQINEYKLIIENKDAVEGESMGLYVEQRVDELQRKNEELHQNLELQKKEVSTLEEQLQGKNESTQRMSDELGRLKVRNSSLQDSYELLMDEKQKVSNLLISSNSKCGEIDALNEKLNEELRLLESKLSNSIGEKERISYELDAKKGDIVLLEEKLKSTSSGLESAIQENCRIMKELETSAESLTYAKSELGESRKTTAESETRITDITQKLAEMESVEIEMEEEITKLEEKLEEESEKSSILQIKLKEADELKTGYLITIDDLKQDLKQKEEDIKILENKLHKLEQRFVLVSTARDGTVLDLMRVNSELELSEDNYNAELRKSDIKIQTLRNDIAQHEENSKTLQNQCYELEERNMKLAETNNNLKLENEEIKAKLNEYLAQQESLKKMHDENSILLSSNSVLKHEIEGLVAKLDESKYLQDSLNMAEEENKVLESLYSGVKYQKENLEAKLNNIESSAALIESEHSDLLNKTNALEEKVAESAETIAQLEDALEQVHKEAKVKDDEIMKLRNENHSQNRFYETDKSHCESMERHLKEELLASKKELIDVNNKLILDADEKEELTKRCDVLQSKCQRLQVQVQEFVTCSERLRLEKMDLESQVESLQDQTRESEDKLKAVRSQFADKYREKQERLASVEQELKEWQARAEEQTSKYDSMARLYNEKRLQLDEASKCWVQAQEDVQNLKLKNESLTRNSSRLSVNKIEEEKKIHSLKSEIQRLTAQLEHADRQIRALRDDSRFSYRPSSINSNIFCSDENIASPRRLTMFAKTLPLPYDNNLFRSQSDTVLDSPSAANKTSFNDSLEDALKTPVNMKNRQCTLGGDGRTPRGFDGGMSRRSCISIESSLLSDSPSRVQQSSSQPQLCESQVRRESLDEKLNSSASGVRSTNTTRSVLSSWPNALGQLDPKVCEYAGSIEMRNPIQSNPALIYQTLHTEEEPGYDYDFGSLSRVAELQGRNAGTLPHLKSSYPVETQGQTPSRCDESVRVGNADKTLHRMSLLPELKRSDLTSSWDEVSIKSNRTSIGSYSELLRQPPLREVQAKKPQPTRRRILHKKVIDKHPKKRHAIDRSRSCDVDLLIQNEGMTWRSQLPDESIQEQIDPRRESIMFEIPNSPRKPLIRSRSKGVAMEKNHEQGGIGGKSKLLSVPLRTPDKTKNKKMSDDKKRTPSLMDRMKKPFSKK